MEEMRGAACFAGSASPFRGRERTAVDIDVCPERCSLRDHETCLALESVEESSTAVNKQEIDDYVYYYLLETKARRGS